MRTGWVAWVLVWGMGGLFGISAISGCAPEPPPRDVLLITVDTLRPDFLSVYGFEQASSPRVDALAAEGVVFDNALAAASLTAPAHASIMTSRFVRQHSIGSRNGETKLEGGVTLAEQFKAAGYRTAAFVSNVVLRRRIGLDRGFDVYDDELPTPELNRSAYFERTADATAQRALEWIAEHPGGGPVFVWLHMQDPHGPYTPPEDYAGRLEDVPLRVKRPLQVLDANSGRIGIPAYQALPGLERPGAYAARYAEEIMFADFWIGEVIDAMRARREGEEPVILLTADHGESMGELGWFFQHGQAATPDLARVPLIVSASGLEPRRESTWVSHVDIAPTLLELAGVGDLREARGVSLVDLLLGEGEVEDRVLFCDTDGEAAAYTRDGIVRALGGPTFALPTPGAGDLRLMGLHEKSPGVWRPAPVGEVAAAAIEAYLGDVTPLAPADDMAPEHIEQLRALGYLDPLDAEPEAAPEGASASEPEDEPAPTPSAPSRLGQ